MYVCLLTLALGAPQKSTTFVQIRVKILMLILDGITSGMGLKIPRVQNVRIIVYAAVNLTLKKVVICGKLGVPLHYTVTTFRTQRLMNSAKKNQSITRLSIVSMDVKLNN
jgi:hypothetical protein